MNNMTIRDSQAAFKNAIDQGLMHIPDEYMYMYSKTFDDGLIHDCFKNIKTRHYETVIVKGAI